jgi:hypothetical protein
VLKLVTLCVDRRQQQLHRALLPLLSTRSSNHSLRNMPALAVPHCEWLGNDSNGFWCWRLPWEIQPCESLAPTATPKGLMLDSSAT